MKRFATIFFVALLGGVVSIFFSTILTKKATPIQESIPSNYHAKFANYSGSNQEVTTDFTKASEISLPTVVHVKTEYAPARNQIYYYDPFRDYMWNQPQQKPSAGFGSGVIISEDGYIITNFHVIKGAEKIEVTLYDKRTYSAEVIGSDPSTDIALLKISETNLPFLLYGNSDNAKVGEWVLAVGNPFNLTSTVTAGIISAKGRNINLLEYDKSLGIQPVESFIQTDAAVNPGNSGGALVNTNGQLIGINSAIASQTGSYSGYSFAIPINLAKKVVIDLKEFGIVQRAFLGVSIIDIDSKLIEEKKLINTKGIFVLGVAQGGGADQGGLLEGDVIVKLGEVDVNTVPELQEQVANYRPGDKVAVKINRNREEKIIEVTLKSKTGETKPKKIATHSDLLLMGATFELAPEKYLKKLNLRGGVMVTSLKSGKLLNVGMEEGFIITSIDRKDIYSIEDLKLAVENKNGTILIEGIFLNGTKAYFTFEL